MKNRPIAPLVWAALTLCAQTLAAQTLPAQTLPAQAEITLFSEHTETRVENLGEMTSSQRAGLEKFTRSRPYFGAIYIETQGNGWGSFTGAHNMKNAMELAERICNEYAKTDSCTLAGVVYPRDLDTKNIPALTMSAYAAEKFRIYSSRTEGFRAFALSGNTAMGWATRRDTPQEAVDAALTYCFTSSMKNLLKLQPDLRAKAIDDGLYICRIIDATRAAPS